MRLMKEQIETIRELARHVAGDHVRVRVFGSRVRDAARGGDLDIMLELSEPAANPALLAARMSALVSRAMDGRRVDVVVSAPNLLRLPIHEMAFREGVLL